VAAVATVAVFAYMGITLVMYLNNPSYGVSMSARAAEWGRDHGLGGMVAWAEQQLYSFNPPKDGGKPQKGAFGHGATTVNQPSAGHLPAPVRMASLAGTPLPGEGVWHAAGRTTSSGIVTTYTAYVRPDPVHTSYVVAVAWMDPTVLRARLYSGSQIPGPKPNGSTHYQYSAPITAADSRNLVDAFNAGFRMQDAHGGYYTDGQTIVPLRRGAAAAVIYKDGTMSVGMWGRDFELTNQVESVRENLNLIVDSGKPVPNVGSSNFAIWGATLGGKAYVWRSGMGVTANGAIVYAAGPTLSVGSLAKVLADAGAVRAMELDINIDWVQYSSFNAAHGAMVNGGDGTSLLSSMVGSPSRYFVNWWNRDFFAMSLRN
jgi:hypothetical protein